MLRERSGERTRQLATLSSHERLGAAAPREHALLGLQRAIGNRAIQRALDRPARDPDLDPVVAGTIEESRGGGHALEAGARGEMESALGVDLADVRVHTDARADSLGRALDARAFTTGRDIFFRAGLYAPETTPGRELLAHELTHVAQQARSPAGATGRLALAESDESERQAESVAKEVVLGGGSAVAAAGVAPAAESSPGAVKRQRAGSKDPRRSRARGRIPDEAIVGTPRHGKSGFEVFAERTRDYVIDLRTTMDEALDQFDRQMHSETEETAQRVALTVSAAVKKCLEFAWDNLSDVLPSKAVPYQFVVHMIGDLIRGEMAETERAATASREVKLTEFINGRRSALGTALQRVAHDLGEGGRERKRLIEAFQSASYVTPEDPYVFEEKVREAAVALAAPTSKEVLRVLTEEFIRTSESEGTSTAFGGVTPWATSVLFIRYVVDAAETRATVDEVTLSGPYAPQMKALLKTTIGDELKTGTLNFTRIVRLEREDLHYLADVHTLRAGTPQPTSPGAKDFFGRFVKTMPTIAMWKIKTQTEPVHPHD